MNGVVNNVYNVYNSPLEMMDIHDSSQSISYFSNFYFNNRLGIRNNVYNVYIKRLFEVVYKNVYNVYSIFCRYTEKKEDKQKTLVGEE